MPPDTVELAPFFLAKHELTQGQWRRFTGANPSKHLAGTQVAGRPLDERSPVEQVSWTVAVEQLARLGWQLPTEAQWEYAARAGVAAPWWTGEEPEGLQGAANLADRFARVNGAAYPTEEALDDGHLVHAPVGSFAPNPFGLHDTVGNVYEWCRDHHVDYTLTARSPDGARGGTTSATRIVRGGSYLTLPRQARAARRDSGQPELESETIGVRPARAVAP
jgi:formylglycine-generating enzyme required for sulfatase activity